MMNVSDEAVRTMDEKLSQIVQLEQQRAELLQQVSAIAKDLIDEFVQRQVALGTPMINTGFDTPCWLIEEYNYGRKVYQHLLGITGDGKVIEYFYRPGENRGNHVFPEACHAVHEFTINSMWSIRRLKEALSSALKS